MNRVDGCRDSTDGPWLNRTLIKSASLENKSPIALPKFKRQLNIDGLDVRKEAVAPTRNNPLVKVALIGLLGRVQIRPFECKSRW